MQNDWVKMLTANFTTGTRNNLNAKEKKENTHSKCAAMRSVGLACLKFANIE